VAAFEQHRHAEMLVLDRRAAASTVDAVGRHSAPLLIRLRYHRRMARVPTIVAGAVVLAAAASAQPPSSKDARLPDSPGKAALLKACNECHGAEAAVGQLKTRDEWSKTLDEMAANGAQATDAEWNQILEYLDKNFSLIFVNKADVKALANTLDVPQGQAEAIVRYREEHGRFASVDDLKQVAGLDAAKVDARKDRFVF
jgi:competence protein ComEA